MYTDCLQHVYFCALYMYMYVCHCLLSTPQFSVVLGVPGLVLALLGRYIPTLVLLYVTGKYNAV